MPPKAKISREMIVDAAFEIAKTEGYENVNARTVAERLNCSTQPVMYHFSTIYDLKKEVYNKADEYHGMCLLNMDKDTENPMLSIGLAYIRFAATEKLLFKFLFQSDEFSGKSLLDLFDDKNLLPILNIMQNEMQLSMEDTKKVFLSLFLFVHGYASMYANNDMLYNEETLISQLNFVFNGSLMALKEETL